MKAIVSEHTIYLSNQAQEMLLPASCMSTDLCVASKIQTSAVSASFC